MESNNLSYAPIRSRFLAFIIDFSIVYFVRILYIQLSFLLYFQNDLNLFLIEYEKLYGKISSISDIELQFFLNSNLFGEILFFVSSLFFVGTVYNIIFLLTKWSSTIGQKLLGIHITSSNGNKLNLLQIISRSILIVMPYYIFFILFLLYTLNTLTNNNTVMQDLLLIYGVAYICWYDMIFFTKDKILFHDLLTKTRVVINTPDTYYDSKLMKVINFIIPDFRDIYSNFKKLISEHISDIKNIFKNDDENIDDKNKSIKENKKESKKKEIKKSSAKKISKQTTKKIEKMVDKKNIKKSKETTKKSKKNDS